MCMRYAAVRSCTCMGRPWRGLWDSTEAPRDTPCATVTRRADRSRSLPTRPHRAGPTQRPCCADTRPATARLAAVRRSKGGGVGGAGLPAVQPGPVAAGGHWNGIHRHRCGALPGPAPCPDAAGRCRFGHAPNPLPARRRGSLRGHAPSHPNAPTTPTRVALEAMGADPRLAFGYRVPRDWSMASLPACRPWLP